MSGTVDTKVSNSNCHTDQGWKGGHMHPSNDHRVPEPGEGTVPALDLRVGTDRSRTGF